ncbi:hypothetical protein Ddye_030962 [Dipteronia dyeriana]|uniref:Cullin family profile domain-containing protein n=1 Tax=Dipteronia dyeriana TaxID=168575 RepID=A0AAD9THD3_9ROSI|nr:hypothetical protein Ddye_030962 [Dipteronia dyeriana]
MEESTSQPCNLGILETLEGNSIQQIIESYNGFCAATKSLLDGAGDLSAGPEEFVSHLHSLCKLGLQPLLRDHFLRSLEESFEKISVSRFWHYFDAYSKFAVLTNPLYICDNEVQIVLCKALGEISLEKKYQEKCLYMLVHALQSCTENLLDREYNSDSERKYLFAKYQFMVSSVLMASLPPHFPEILHWYFKGRLEELSAIMDGELEDNNESQDKDDVDLDEKGKFRAGEMDVDGCYNHGKYSEKNKLVKHIGKIFRDLRSLGFTSMTENAYASAIFSLLKAKVHDLAGDDYRSSVLESIKGWIQVVPLQFLNALLAYLGDSISYDSSSAGIKSPLASFPSIGYHRVDTPTEGLIRWQLRLEYFAYETLQNLRIAKLFEIIVDYPESSPAIEDLKQCLEYTGQHSKLVESFISALKYRLLTAVGTQTDLSGNTGDSLLEELNRDEESQENVGIDDDINVDDKQAWINAMRWEPDPVEADPLKGSRNRRKVDILGMVVCISGSKDQLVNEYRVMLAEKLLNKSDYDIDSEIRILELLKIHFGESSMQRCEIMLNDLIDSKRTNTNIKATAKKQSQTGAELGENWVSLDILDATIISSNFWPPMQDEALIVPGSIDKLLSDYATRFKEIKTPRKLLWKKNLGTVKLELQFDDRAVQFTVAPIHAVIIVQFQDQTSVIRFIFYFQLDL